MDSSQDGTFRPVLSGYGGFHLGFQSLKHHGDAQEDGDAQEE
jgi:hypothetical protein